MARLYTPKGRRGWYGDWTDANGKRIRCHLSNDKRTAQRILNEKEREVDLVRAGLRPNVGNDAAIADLWREFRVSLVTDGLAPRTVEQYEQYVPRFFEALGAVKASDVTLDKADAYKADRQRGGASARTVNIALQRAKRMLSWAVDHGKIGSNPLERLKMVRAAPVHERRALTVTEIGRLLEASPDHYRRTWALYLCTGIRRNELVYLRWRDVNLDRRTIRLEAGRTKTREERLCFFGPKVEAMLREIGPGEPDALVFPTERGTPRKNNLRRALRACCKRAGIDLTGVDLHGLRATFATLVMESGADLKTAQTLVGHGRASGILLLDKYARPRMLRLHEAAAEVEALVFDGNAASTGTHEAPQVRAG